VRKLKRLIVTADDFGLSTEVNRAVVTAHQAGILVCASLMVTGRASQEAVSLAKQHPSLKVGLHLVLVDGFAELTRKEIPDLVDDEQRFSDRPALSGVRYFFSPGIKRQLVMECRAQIEKFLAAGLIPDHLNSHHHLHIHPTLTDIIIALAKEYHIKAVRLPFQGLHLLNWKSVLIAGVMLPWTMNLWRALRKSGIVCNEKILGLYQTGTMSEETWLRLIPTLKPGTTEIFCHPAVGACPRPEDAKFIDHQAEELRALISPRVRDCLTRMNVRLSCFGDISG
jgi:hopanoid biosynthesis associated protein HpnK